MAVTLKDVAERAGVSRSAVSRTFTDGASVSARTRAKVEEQAADELGYAPNALASSLTTGRTKLIGLIANNFHNPLILEVFDLFTRGLQDRGLRPLLVNLSGATDPAASVRMLRQYSVDGVIVASSTLPPSFAAAFRTGGPARRACLWPPAPAPDVPVVGIDNMACGRMAAEALIAARLPDAWPSWAGHRRPPPPRTVRQAFSGPRRHPGITAPPALPPITASTPAEPRCSACSPGPPHRPISAATICSPSAP
jgi:DNA-binding LacI/PurR family transcriptional regulator